MHNDVHVVNATELYTEKWLNTVFQIAVVPFFILISGVHEFYPLHVITSRNHPQQKNKYYMKFKKKAYKEKPL